MRMTTREWQQAFAEGRFRGTDVRTQIEAGWYDWFCKETSLANKTKRLGSIIAQVEDGGKVDLDRTYVWFKNSCPACGPLYDGFRFSDIETGDIVFAIVVEDEHEEFKYSVWGRDNGFNGPIIGFGHSRELVKWLNEAY